jgi:hypothetical protein
MPDYIVKKGGRLKHDGKFYGPGDTVSLTEEQAKQVEHVLIPAAQLKAARKVPEKK